MDKENRKREEEAMQPDKRKKIKRVERCVLSVLLAAVFAAVGFVSGWFGRWGALGKNKQALLWAIDKTLENYYRDVDEGKLYENLFAAFDLDPYSTYYPASDYEDVVSEREGWNNDAGFSIWQDSHIEVSVLANSSASDAGIESGMYFLKYGKTNKIDEMTEANNAEYFFDFLTTVDMNGKYYVLCGESENESEATVYELTNDENGAGLALTRKYETMRVYQVVGNSPADKAGLRRGMYILKYGATAEKDKMVSGSTGNFRAFVASLDFDLDGKGKKTNTKTFYLQCSFDKDADPEPVKITMTEYLASYCYYRDNTLSYRFRTKDNLPKNEKPKLEREETGEFLSELDDNTGYIALTEFTASVADQFKECLKYMKDHGKSNLILDLRGNGGGYMTVLVDIAACFLKDAGSGNQKIAYAIFRNGGAVSYSAYGSSYNSYFSEDSRITVLADEYTASASECLIGAMVDYGAIKFSDIYLHQNGKGIAKTYGKGIMQTSYDDDPAGGALKITVADVYWPKSGKNIHGVGVNTGDGANAVSSSLLPDANDSFLQDVIKGLKTSPSAPVF